MPPSRNYLRPRQDPVSCNVCRHKKLKCDRNLPCSNCKSRKIACEYRGERPPIVDDRNDDDIRAENVAIKARLDRLEQAFYSNSTQIKPSLEVQVYTPTTKDSPLPNPKAVQADEDSKWLERLGDRADLIMPLSSARLVIHVQTMGHALLASDQLPGVRNTSVPTREVANLLLDEYAQNMDATQHILHITSTRQMLNDVYQRMANSQEIDPGALCLVLGICASASYFYTASSSRGKEVLRDHDTACRLARHWAKQGMYAMEQIQSTTTTEPTLEAIQSMVILTFLFYHMEGFTCRMRFMHSSGIIMAKALGLHKLDAPNGYSPPYSRQDIIDKEVRRKVWWHLTCSDWVFSFVGGPQEGTHSIGTHDMMVNIPRNLSPHDLDTQPPDFTRPLSEPTEMAYYLQRIKLAATCRDVTETLWRLIRFTDPLEVDYHTVTVLDAKFDAQLRDLPRFMHLDITCSQLRVEYGELSTQSLDVQRILVHLMLNTRRSQLHLPFLLRAKMSPKFEPSRVAGLHSARAVFETRRLALQDTESLGAVHFELGGILQVSSTYCTSTTVHRLILLSMYFMPLLYW